LNYLLDTNVVSAFRRPERLPAGVAKWAKATPTDSARISTITLLEIERGILKEEALGTAFGAALRHWMTTHVEPTYSDTALPVTAQVALRAAIFHELPTVELADHLIAATALVHNLVLVTRNTAHFQDTGVRLMNPWAA
jgi:predicted nucleic acid-binding protein